MGITLSANWHEQLQEELAKPYVREIKAVLERDKAAGIEVYPPEQLIFNAFRQTPFDEVKAVIMGQDPYHGPGQAHGLCFSVEQGVTPPPSLKNIYKELQSDLGIPPANHGCLTSWAKQGVLLLNATLTVQRGKPRSHYGIGWERFTDSVIATLRDRDEPIVFILWGKSAQEKCRNVLDLKEHHHAILACAHPSPYSAENFFGCRHFSKANELLQRWGKEPINWAL